MSCGLLIRIREPRVVETLGQSFIAQQPRLIFDLGNAASAQGKEPIGAIGRVDFLVK